MVQEENLDNQYNTEHEVVCEMYETIPLGIRIIIDRFVQKYSLEFFFQNALIDTYRWIQQFDHEGHEQLSVERRIKKFHSSYLFTTLNNHQIPCGEWIVYSLGQCNEYQLLFLTGFAYFFPKPSYLDSFHNILLFLRSLFILDLQPDRIDPSLRHLWLQVYSGRRQIEKLTDFVNIPQQIELQRDHILKLIEMGPCGIVSEQANIARTQSGILGTALHRVVMLNESKTSPHIQQAFRYIGQSLLRLQPKGLRRTPYINSFEHFGINHDIYIKMRELLVDLWCTDYNLVSEFVHAIALHLQKDIQEKNLVHALMRLGRETASTKFDKEHSRYTGYRIQNLPTYVGISDLQHVVRKGISLQSVLNMLHVTSSSYRKLCNKEWFRDQLSEGNTEILAREVRGWLSMWFEQEHFTTTIRVINYFMECYLALTEDPFARLRNEGSLFWEVPLPPLGGYSEKWGTTVADGIYIPEDVGFSWKKPTIDFWESLNAHLDRKPPGTYIEVIEIKSGGSALKHLSPVRSPHVNHLLELYQIYQHVGGILPEHIKIGLRLVYIRPLGISQFLFDDGIPVEEVLYDLITKKRMGFR